jgi:hypothetical protein
MNRPAKVINFCSPGKIEGEWKRRGEKRHVMQAAISRRLT